MNGEFDDYVCEVLNESDGTIDCTVKAERVTEDLLMENVEDKFPFKKSKSEILMLTEGESRGRKYGDGEQKTGDIAVKDEPLENVSMLVLTRFSSYLIYNFIV